VHILTPLAPPARTLLPYTTLFRSRSRSSQADFLRDLAEEPVFFEELLFFELSLFFDVPLFVVPDFFAPDFFVPVPFFAPPVFLLPLLFFSAPLSSVVPAASRRPRTLRSRASIRLITVPPSSEASSACSWPKVASVSTVSPSSSFASSRRRSSAWYSSVNRSGSKSSLNCSTRAADIDISSAEIFDFEGPKSTSLRSVGQRSVCRARRSSCTRSTPRRVFVRSVKVTIAVRSVSSRVRRS